jgi:hypothetical protein
VKLACIARGLDQEGIPGVQDAVLVGVQVEPVLALEDVRALDPERLDLQAAEVRGREVDAGAFVGLEATRR